MTTDWAAAYTAALNDVETLATSRELMTPGLRALIEDMRLDALVIGHAIHNRDQRRKLAVGREVQLDLLTGK